MNSYLHRGLCSLSFILLSISLSPVSAKTPKTAKIVFTSSRDGDGEIYIMNADGSKQVNLTQHGAREGAPVWAPTGERIAFHSDRHGLRDIYIMDADGKNVQKVLKNLAYREFPTWSPDGKKLAYFRGDTQAIYVADIDEQQEEHVALTGALGGFPAWSPDGSAIVFTFRFKQNLGHTVLRVVNLNTRKEKTLFENEEPASLTGAAWSLENEKIAFGWLKKGIYIVNRDGSGLSKIVSGAYPAWAPQGDELLYSTKEGLFKFNLGSRRSEQLTAAGNVDGDWFDPAVLPVQPQAHLLTTLWGKIKQN